MLQCAKLLKRVEDEKLDVNILVGTEIYCGRDSIDYIAKLLQVRILPSLNGTAYVLCEFGFWDGSLDDILFCVNRLKADGWIPVIAHVERYADYLSKDDMKALVSNGALLQVNASDFLVNGHFPEWVEMTKYLVKNEMVSFIGSDMHSVDRRVPKMSEAVEYLIENCSEEYINRLLFSNAKELIEEGKEMGEVMAEKICADTNNKYLSGVMGVVVGDALGASVQFMDRKDVDKNPVIKMLPCAPFGLPEGTWTDDSSLTIAMLASLKDKKEYDIEDIAKRFCDWLLQGEYTPYGSSFDIGYTCEVGIRRYYEHKDVKTCGLTGVRDNGNGSLMRTVPICLYVYEKVKAGQISEDDGINMIHEVSALTHAHFRSKMACGLYYFIIKHILDEKAGKKLQEILQDGINEGLKYYGKDIQNLTEIAYFGRLFDLEELKNTDRDDISSSGYVISTFEAALWSLLRTSSFEEALLLAVNLADDSDTVGAVTGGLAGLFYGYKAIPDDWLGTIKKRDWIEDWCLK